MKKLKIISFWIGVNILGLPKYVEHTIEHCSNKNRNVSYISVKEDVL